MTEMRIRPMELTDIDDVHTVDVASFSSPWKKETFEHEVNMNEYAHYFIVETDEGSLVGYVGIWLILEDAQITNIAIQYAMNEGAKRLSLEVRVSNIIAQQLYRKFGLVPGGIRKGYYPDNGEDAIVMWVELT